MNTGQDQSRDVSSSLPKPFVQSMRILFDIMDDKQVGVVKFSEIEQRWNKDDNKPLSKGLLDCLRNVTTASGDLTFERFCAGLKICLLKNESEKSHHHHHQASDPVPPPKPPRMSTMSQLNCQPVASVPAGRLERRHTLQNGIDYKRLKQLEQEKNLLKDTLLTVNATQHWLNQKLELLQGQLRHGAPLDSSPDDQERLDLRRAQLSEVNRQLMRLMQRDYAAKSDLVLELNLATPWGSHERMQQLKHDNRRLAEELNQKQNVITCLENEKMRLIRQLKRY